MQALIDDARKAIESGRADEGVTLADRALAMDPKSARAYNIRAYGRLQRSNYAGAIADCDKALALLPGLVGPYLHRAIARKRTGDFNGAMQDYAAAIEQYEAEALYHREKGFELQAKNDTGGAAKEGEAEQQARDDEADAFYSRAIALFDTGRYEQSLVDFDQAINLSTRRV